MSELVQLGGFGAFEKLVVLTLQRIDLVLELLNVLAVLNCLNRI